MEMFLKNMIATIKRGPRLLHGTVYYITQPSTQLRTVFSTIVPWHRRCLINVANAFYRYISREVFTVCDSRDVSLFGFFVARWLPPWGGDRKQRYRGDLFALQRYWRWYRRYDMFMSNPAGGSSPSRHVCPWGYFFHVGNFRFQELGSATQPMLTLPG